MHYKRILIPLAAAAFLLAVLYGAVELAIDREFRISAPVADYPVPANQFEARTQDIAYFRQFLDLDRSYTAETRAAAETMLEALATKLNSLSDAGFELAIARAVAVADNGHTNIWMGSFSRAHGRLPIGFYWFSDGLYVLSAEPEYTDLLGAKLIAVGEAPFDQAAKQLRQFVGGTWEVFRAYRGPALFELPVAHYAAGLSESEEAVEMSFESADGSLIRKRIDVKPIAEEAPLTTPISHLYSYPHRSAITPLYLQNPGSDFQIVELPGNGLYIQYRNNNGDGIEEFGNSVRARARAKAPSFFVVDQRFNGGGDYTLTRSLMSDLPAMVVAGGPIYIITGPATFSAGINSVAFARAAGGEQVLLIGERIGDRERMYGETNDFELPNSKLGMTFNTGLHDVANGCPPWPECYWRNYLNDIAVGKLDPDIEILTSFKDYQAGIDPVLEAILRE